VPVIPGASCACVSYLFDDETHHFWSLCDPLPSLQPRPPTISHLITLLGGCILSLVIFLDTPTSMSHSHQFLVVHSERKARKITCRRQGHAEQPTPFSYPTTIPLHFARCICRLVWLFTPTPISQHVQLWARLTFHVLCSRTQLDGWGHNLRSWGLWYCIF